MGGRCWIRTNVAFSGGFTGSRQPSCDLRIRSRLPSFAAYTPRVSIGDAKPIQQHRCSEVVDAGSHGSTRPARRSPRVPMRARRCSCITSRPAASTTLPTSGTTTPRTRCLPRRLHRRHAARPPWPHSAGGREGVVTRPGRGRLRGTVVLTHPPPPCCVVTSPLTTPSSSALPDSVSTFSAISACTEPAGSFGAGIALMSYKKPEA